MQDVLAQAGDEGGHLRRNLGARDIGTGIFTLTGIEATQHAGPAVAVSFVVAVHLLHGRRHSRPEHA